MSPTDPVRRPPLSPPVTFGSRREQRWAAKPETAGWANRMMRVSLHTPGLEKALGKTVALIAFQGRRTGTIYETPVSYAHLDGSVIVLSRVSRLWWRNLGERPVVRLRLAGEDRFGRSTVKAGDESELDTVIRFLERRRFDAKAYGVSLGPDGQPSRADVRRLLPEIVIIRVELEDLESRSDEDTTETRKET